MKKNRSKIYIIDDHILFRAGLIKLLSDQESFEILGDSDSPRSFIQSGMAEKTDLLLLDITLGDFSGLDYIDQIKDRNQNIRILILSMHNKPLLLKRAINSDIDGYVLKESPEETLLKAMETLLLGDKFLDTKLSASIFSCLTERNSSESLYNRLTAREQEIFRLFASGYDSRGISKELDISRKTVDNHRLNIMTKLKLKNISEVISYAGLIGII